MVAQPAGARVVLRFHSSVRTVALCIEMHQGRSVGRRRRGCPDVSFSTRLYGRMANFGGTVYAKWVVCGQKIGNRILFGFYAFTAM